MLKTLVYRIICVLMLLFVAQPFANATIILLVIKPDAVWISADGMRSGASTWSTVCKAHQAYGGVILKYGYVGEASPNTDDVLQKLIRENKSYEEFKKAAQTAFPAFMNSAATAGGQRSFNSQFEMKQHQANESVGLVFVGVASGRLFVDHILFAPLWVSEGNIFGQQGQFNYAASVWNQLGQQPASFVFPESLREPQRNLDWIFDNPEHMLHALEVSEDETPCMTQPPNVYMKISIARPVEGKKYTKRELRDLSTSAIIDQISPGACPSWDVVPSVRPAACTPLEEQRELQGGLLVQ